MAYYLMDFIIIKTKLSILRIGAKSHLADLFFT